MQKNNKTFFSNWLGGLLRGFFFLSAFALVGCLDNPVSSGGGGGAPSGITVNYTVSFNSSGGSFVPSQQVPSGNRISRPTNPAKSGFNFVNWYQDAGLTQVFDFNTAITGEFTLYAKWSRQTVYTITFNANGGSSVTEQRIPNGGVVQRPNAPTRSGYTFVNWFRDAGFTQRFDFDTAITANLTLYAKWTANSGGGSGDFTTLNAAGNQNTHGLWSDGTTMWVADLVDRKLYAYRLSDKARDASKDFNTLIAAGNNSPEGIWSDATTMWVVDHWDEKIYAYRMSDKARDPAKDFNTLSAAGNNNPEEIWSDGTTMWVTDTVDEKIYAYRLSDKQRDSSKDFNLSGAGRNNAKGIWSDRTTMWVAYRTDDKIYAYRMSDKQRDSSKDFNTLSAAGNTDPEGIWSDGTTMWVADLGDGKIYAYSLRTKQRTP